MRKLSTLLAVVTATTMLFSMNSPADADTLDDIKASGKMTVGIDPTFPPYEYTDDNGAITGYTVEIMQSFANDLGVKLEFQKMAFSGIIPGLIAGSFHVEGSSLNVTAERAKRVLYTVPFSKTVNGVLVRRADKGKFDGASLTIEQLAGLSGAAKSASVPEQLLKTFNQQLEQQGLKPITIVSVDTLDQTVSALMARRADFVIDDISVLAPLIKKHPRNMAQIGEVGPSQWMAWATRKADTRLNNAISAHILALQQSGRLAALQQRYLGTTITVPADNFIPQE